MPTFNPDNLNSNELIVVPPEEFRANWRPLTPEELAELGETPPITTEISAETIETTDAFLKDTFETWNKDTAPNAKIFGTPRLPINQDWSALKTDVDTTKFGEYTLNPETQNLNFEQVRVFTPDLSAFEGKPLSEVADHLTKTYGDKYYLPGLEYEQWLYQHPDQAPAQLKDGNYHFFFGSTLRRSRGNWCVPCVRWRGSEWDRNARWLSDAWNSYFRVVLLER